MNGGLAGAVTTLAAVTCALMGGVFFAFSTIVMSGLRRLSHPGGLVAMQSINAAVGPVFLAALFLPALACVALGLDAMLDLGAEDARLRLAGSLLYLLGAIVLTIGYHIPRNLRLDAVDTAQPDAAANWLRYAADWTRWNHVRAIASLAAAAAFTIALARGR
ncbi:MAG: DUF1772 domain-containing protein [Geodermatophilaceae bacterium]